MTRNKVKLLSDHDLREIVKFQEYLADLRGTITPKAFAEKYADYMGCTPDVASKHVDRVRAESEEEK